MSLHRCFDRALARWRNLHDLSDPRQRAAYDRGVETWRWVVLLDPWVGPRTCIAALFAERPQVAGALIDLDLAPADLDHVLRLIAADDAPDLAHERGLIEEARGRAMESTGLRRAHPPRLAKVSGTFSAAAPANDWRRDGTG